MIEAAHGVVGVGGGDSSCGNAFARLGGGGVTVAEADAHSERRRMPDELERIGELRRDRHETDVAARCLPKTVEELDGGRLQQGRRMHTALGVREEWAFEMNAERHGAFDGTGGFDQRREAVEGAQGVIHRRQ